MMRQGIDWHVHTWEGSNESKGVAEVIKEAIAAGLEGISITDHNSVAGIDKAIELAGDDLKIIPGIELDAIYEGKKSHIVCYLPDYKKPGFQQDLDDISRGRRKRMFDIVEKFAENEYIPKEDIKDIISEINERKVYTTMAVADILLIRYENTETELGKELARLDKLRSYTTPRGKLKGDIDLRSKLMYELLDKGRFCYVGYDKENTPDYKEVVDFCKKYNAPCGFAHIVKDLKDHYLVEEAFKDGMSAGMKVIGVGYPKHSEYDQHVLHRLVFGLDSSPFSGIVPLNGTDYHAKPGQSKLGDIRSLSGSLQAVEELK